MASGRKEEVTAKGRARMKVGMDGRGVALLVEMKRRVLIMDIRDRIIFVSFNTTSREVMVVVGENDRGRRPRLFANEG